MPSVPHCCIQLQSHIFSSSFKIQLVHYVASGACDEPLKAAKECSTTMYTRVPSKYKFEPARFPYKESAHLLVVFVMHMHKLLVSSVHSIESSSINDMSDYFQKVSCLRMQFVFRWHRSCMLLPFMCS